MDVTALLNTTSSAAEQQKKVELLTLPNRSRTPWDAGGYSLPINSRTIPQSPPDSVHHGGNFDDLREGASSSPTHRFTDSRSSLSSFSSSLYSATHSRFSSMSTVNSYHPSNGLTTQSLSPKSSTYQTPDIESNNPSTNEAQSQDGHSPMGSLDTPALSPETHGHVIRRDLTPNFEQQEHETIRSESQPNTSTSESTTHTRPSSPSDAILIKRTNIPILNVNTEDERLSEPEAKNNNYLHAPVNPNRHLLHSSKTHKRALSAPNFSAPNTAFIMADAGLIGQQGEPTPPPSQHPGRDSPVTPNYPAPDTPPTIDEDPEEGPYTCMYIPNCDTGSSVRKAISHIFGRNKMCTRSIPQNVWVHYCRKHYQRARYRNPKEYAKLQCDLVQTQIRRIHAWSESNVAKGIPSTVQDWSIAVRKREAQRREKGGAMKKRKRSTTASDDEDGEDAGSGEPIPQTAVPDWLAAVAGGGYDTHGVLSIFNRLHQDILDNITPAFPDIEILPSISVDTEGAKAARNFTKRASTSNAATNGHKRAKSLGMATLSIPTGNIAGQATGYRSGYNPSVHKRTRPEQQQYEVASPVILPPIRPSNVDHGIDSVRRNQQTLAHRPMFPFIDEHQASGHDFSHETPLAAPTPQRFRNQSLVAHLEVGNASTIAAPRRAKHGRSQSDLSAISRSSTTFGDFPPHSPFRGDLLARQQYVFPRGSRAVPSDMRSTAQFPAHTHARHASTSMVPHMYSPTLARGNSTPTHRPHTFTPRTLSSPPNSHIPLSEVRYTRDLYSSRC